MLRTPKGAELFLNIFGDNAEENRDNSLDKLKTTFLTVHFHVKIIFSQNLPKHNSVKTAVWKGSHESAL